MSEWPSHTVAALQAVGVLLVEDGNHGEYRPRPDEFVEGGTAYIRATDLSDGQVRFDDASGISEPALRRIRKGVGRPGDILFSHKGTVGKLARVPLDCPPFVCSPQTTFWRVLDESVLRRDYLFAYMQSRTFIDQWWARKGETDMADYVSLTAQRELRVTLPPVDVQRRIAEPLAAIDDLIENNRRRVQVLEDLAWEIYREWFIQFRYPGYEHDTIASSGSGRPPSTWEAGRVADLLLLQRGFDLPVGSRRPGAVPIIGASGRGGWHDFAKVAGPGVVTGRSGSVGSTTYVDLDHWPLNTALWVKDYRRSTPRHAYFLLRSLDLRGMAGGATMPMLNRNVVHATPVPLPPSELIEHYDRAVLPLFEDRFALARQTDLLEGVRTTLLPKLVSGRIDISSLDLGSLTAAAPA